MYLQILRPQTLKVLTRIDVHIFQVKKKKKKSRLQKYFRKCEQWLFHAMGFRQFFTSALYFFVLFEVFIVCVHYIYEKK